MIKYEYSIGKIPLTISARALIKYCVSIRMSDNRVSLGSLSILAYTENVQEVTSLVLIIFFIIH